MSIYKGKNKITSSQQLAQIGEAGIYSAFLIKDNFVINAIRGILFLVLGSFSLPLRATFRFGIGERSLDFIKSCLGGIILIYIAIYGFTFDGLVGQVRVEHKYPIEIWGMEVNLLILLYVGAFFLAITGHQYQQEKDRFKKKHSYYRGKTLLHLLSSEPIDDTNLWRTDSVLWLFAGFLLVNFDPIFGGVIVTQAIALLIEENIIAKRKRYAVLDIIDAQIESKIITEERAKFLERGQIKKQKSEEIEDVTIA